MYLRCDSVATRRRLIVSSHMVSSSSPNRARQKRRWKSRTAMNLVCLAFALVAFAAPEQAQESPYIVTYDHYLEEPGSLEVEYFSNFGTQRGGNDFHAFWAELEYGATAWWTTELYLEGQTTFNDSTIFTGLRWENRFRPLKREHFINPVFYVEYENKNGADKIMKEGEGHDVESDLVVSNAED